MSEWPWFLTVKPIVEWPGEFTNPRRTSPFYSPIAKTLPILRRELDELAAEAPILQVAIDSSQFRLDGFPRQTARATHPGIILTLPESKYGPLSYPCDRFHTWQDNLRAISLALEALRKVDRYGVTKRGEQYAGWKQLPSTSSGLTEAEAFQVLLAAAGVDEPTNSAAQLLRIARGVAHPDRNNGQRDAWDLVEQAALALGLT